MSDIKIFKIQQDNETLDELKDKAFPKEIKLHKLIEKNIESIFGITFLKSEFGIKTKVQEDNKKKKPRIDSIGIDKDYRPVIFEYKRREASDTLLSQVRGYRDCLVNSEANHLKFQGEILEKFDEKKGVEINKKIKWKEPRVICIVNKFPKNIIDARKSFTSDCNRERFELILYKKYGHDILFEFINSESDFSNSQNEAKTIEVNTNASTSKRTKKNKTVENAKKEKTFREQLDEANNDLELKKLYNSVTDFIKDCGNSDNIKSEVLKYYKAFKINKKNFVSLLFRLSYKSIVLYLWDLKPEKYDDTQHPLIRNAGKNHLGTGNIEVKISNTNDLEQIKHLIKESYDIQKNK